MNFSILIILIAFFSTKGINSEIKLNLGIKNFEALKDILIKHYPAKLEHVDLPNISGSMLLGKYKGTNIHYSVDQSSIDVLNSHILLNEEENKIIIKITNVTCYVKGLYSYKLGFISEIFNILGSTSKGVVQINIDLLKSALEITVELSVEYADFSLTFDPPSTGAKILSVFKYLYYHKIIGLITEDIQATASKIQNKLNSFLLNNSINYSFNFVNELTFNLSKISDNYFKENLEFSLPFKYFLTAVNETNPISKGKLFININQNEIQKNMSLFIDWNIVQKIKEYIFREEVSHFFIECPVLPITFFLNCTVSNEINYFIKDDQLLVEGSNFCDIESSNQSHLSGFSLQSKYEVYFNYSIKNNSFLFFTNGSQVIIKDLIFTNHKGSDITFFEDNLESISSSVAEYFNYVLNQSNHFLNFRIPSLLNITEIKITNKSSNLVLDPVVGFNENETIHFIQNFFS